MKNKTLLVFVVITSLINIAFIVFGILYGLNGYKQPYIALFITMFILAYNLDARIIVSIICNIFKKRINIEKKKYKISNKEYKILSQLKIDYWKNHFITMFKHQFEFNSTNRKERIKIILKNNINAEIIHFICFFVGLLAIPLGYLLSKEELLIYIITSLLGSLLFDLPPILIQRYNRYRLYQLKLKLDKKESKIQ